MAIPDYQTLMKPLLRAIGDGKVHAVNSVIKQLADEFGLTPDERMTRVPSGNQPLFSNRVYWAVMYVKKAGLLASPSRGAIQITERGRQVLTANPA
ncbi:MAG: winged helix-turn-helix domain-containing protein, partial [Syntrophomonadaceae bacterium]|nr:winged helix-turn-helix domain-containing protein [Syntrophomonadaceae bacterium]